MPHEPVQAKMDKNRRLMHDVFDFLVEQGLQVTIRGVHIPSHMVMEPWGVEVQRIEDFDKLAEVHTEMKKRFGCTFTASVLSASLQVITEGSAHRRRITGG